MFNTQITFWLKGRNYNPMFNCVQVICHQWRQPQHISSNFVHGWRQIDCFHDPLLQMEDVWQEYPGHWALFFSITFSLSDCFPLVPLDNISSAAGSLFTHLSSVNTTGVYVDFFYFVLPFPPPHTGHQHMRGETAVPSKRSKFTFPQ